MSSKFFMLFIFILSPLMLVLGQTDSGAKPHEFVGVKTCGMCHHTDKQGKQLEIWKNSAHSKAYEVLKTDKANKIAKEKGFSTPAVETEACLKCHTSGYNVDKSLLGAKFNISDGVQCETCHGAGADYKSLKVMKNKKEAIANGLQLHENLKEFCSTCHNSESPTYVEQDVNKMWEKIKHPIPTK